MPPTQRQVQQGDLFDINALLAGSAEVYVSEVATVPPLLGYPITTAVADNFNDEGVVGTFTRGSGTTLWDGTTDPENVTIGGTAKTASKNIATGLVLGAVTFDISRSKPTLRASITATAASAGAAKTLVDNLRSATGTNGADMRSLFIQYFGRSAEFPFNDGKANNADDRFVTLTSGDAANSGTDHVATYTWEIGNKLEVDKIRQYTLFQIPAKGKFIMRSGRTGSTDAIEGYNGQWSTYGDGLISRDAAALATNQTINPLEIAAVIPAVELFREGAESILSFTCFSASQAFVARITGQDPSDIVQIGDPTSDAALAYQQLAIAPKSSVNKFAVCLRMDDAPNEKGKMSQIYLPSVGITGNTTLGLARTPQGTPVELTTIFNALWQTNALYMTQNNAWAFTL